MKKVITVIMLTIMLGVIPGTKASASISKNSKSVTQAYHNKLDHGRKNDNPRVYVDINGDKVKECIYVHADVDAYDHYIGIYGYKNNRVIRMKKIKYARGTNINYSKKKHRILVESEMFDGSEYSVYNVKKFKVRKVKSLNMMFVSTRSGKKIIYKINKKNVSAQTFKKQIKGYKKNTKQLTSW